MILILFQNARLTSIDTPANLFDNSIKTDKHWWLRHTYHSIPDHLKF